MNKFCKLFLTVFLFFSFNVKDTVAQSNDGWQILFNGENLDHWQTSKGEKVSSADWTIKDGILSMVPNTLGKGTGRDLFTKEKFENFELVMSFKLTKRANTGVKYLVNSLKDEKGRSSMIGVEYQLIDDVDYPAPVAQQTPDGLTGAAYLFYPPNHKKKFAVYDWNTMKIIKQNANVEHWLNGKRILKYKIGSAGYLEKLSKNKFKVYPELKNINTGMISIQDHGDLAYFKDIKVRRLN